MEGFLLTTAEVSVAVAGFSGLMLAIKNRAFEQWPKQDRYGFRVLLQVPFMVLLFSLLLLPPPPVEEAGLFPEELPWP